MNVRAVLLLLLCCYTVNKAAAQQLFTLNGVVYKKGPSTVVQQAIVTNTHTKTMMMSDELGGFSILASKGDTLIIKKVGFNTQLIPVRDDKAINIYLQPTTMLNEVAIKDQSKKQELAEVMGQYKTVGGYYTLTPSLWSFINSPITGLYEYLGEEPNRARKFQQYTREELEHIEVNKKYTPALVKQVTGITDDKEVHDFMLAFTPGYEEIKTWNEYDVIKYIKKSYAYYKNNKNVFKVQKLN